MAAKSSSQGSVAASEVRVYIQDDNHDKEILKTKITQKISSEKSVNLHELEDTPQKRSVALNVYRVRRTMWRDEAMT